MIPLVGIFILYKVHGRTDTLGPNPDLSSIPQDYRGIPFHAWLDIFLEYALNLAHHGKLTFSYDVIAGARDANVFYHSSDSILLIHVCWFSGSLASSVFYIANQESQLVRFFETMRQPFLVSQGGS